MPKESTRVQTARGLAYPDPVDSRITRPSVTTILSIIAKPALPRWSARLVAEQAIRDFKTGYMAEQVEKDREAYEKVLINAPYVKTSHAQAIGTHVHAVADAMATGEDWPKLPAALPETLILDHATQFNMWCEEDKPTFLFTEVEVVNRTVDYGGRFDSFIRLPPTKDYPMGEVVLVDIKTGKDIYAEVALQLTAYDHSEQAILGNKLFKMPKADSLAVLLLHADEHHFLRITPHPGYWEAFKAARVLWGWDQWMKSNKWLEPREVPVDANDPLSLKA